MSRNLKIKAALLVAFAIASTVAMGFVLSAQQDGLSLESYRSDIEQEREALPGLLESAASETEQNTSTFDEIYRSKAETLRFMALHETGFEVTDAKMQEYRELLGVDNVLVVNRAGEILAQAQETPADFSYERYNQLRAVIGTDSASQAMEVTFAETGRTLRYYAAPLPGDAMAVIEQDPAELDELVAETGSLASVLRTISVGQNGYVVAVSARDYLIEYHPDERLTGTDALVAGVDVTALEDGNHAWVTLDGERLYCGVSKIGDTYYLLAVPESDMAQSRNITVGVILFAFFSVLMTVILYGLFVMRDEEKRGFDPKNYRSLGPLRYNKAVGRKAIVLSFVGFLGVMLVTFYMQTLFSLSAESVSSSQRAADIAGTIQRTNEQADALTEQYDERYLSKAEAAAYILDRDAGVQTKEGLQELADVLQVQYLYVFDGEGVLQTTNSSYTNFVLSDDPRVPVLRVPAAAAGRRHVIQEPQPDDVSGELRQYIGVTLHDAEGNADGFVQLGIRSERLTNLLASVEIGRILDGVKVGANGFAFAVNRNDNTFAYYPQEQMEGRGVAEYGMAETQVKAGFNDYLAIDGTTYYASSVETGDYYVYIAQPADELMSERVPITLTTGISGLVCQIVVFLLLTLEPRRPRSVRARAGEAAGEDGEDGEAARMIDVTMPDGRVKKTESAVSRWLSTSMQWHEKSAEQRIGTVVKAIVAVFAIAVCLAVLFQDQIFGSDSVFAYILGGGWERGLNVFAVTACVMIACVVLTLTMIVRELLRMLSSVFGARGETMCRLVSSFIKYASIIGMLYYCLMVIGIDTTTLLASAGILSIAVSFGAKELVSDILSGLFIIFEGEFRVGDIIKVGSSTGTVMEIGVRTTKINDGSGNVIVLRNSDVSNVVNMTKDYSFATCEVGIEYAESLERVENILETEFPNIRRRLPAIQDGPFYKGIVALADNSVNIRIVAKCHESDRGQLERDLRREMKLIFDEYDISIPFPQVVVNQPREFREATLAEQLRAEQFNAEQKEAAKDVGNEDLPRQH